MLGLGFRIGKGGRVFSEITSGFTMHVDSVGGNDSNDGLTPQTAKQTLTAAVTASSSGEIIGLAKGSHWRESFNISSIANVQVGVYGTGNPPIIDGADIVTSWSKSVGLTNVYEASISHDAVANNRLNVFENGDFLTRVTSDALCDSTPGSFVKVLGSAGTPVTVKIHTTDSAHPTGNAKLYEVTTRTNGLYGGNDATINGPIQTQRVMSNNGSTDFLPRTGIHLDRILAAYGTKHNLAFGHGTGTNLICYKADEVIAEEPSATAFVNYLENGSGYTACLDKCGVIGPNNGTDYLAHGNPNSFDEIKAIQFWNTGWTFPGGWDYNIGSFYADTISIPVTFGKLSGVLIDATKTGGGASSIGLYGVNTMSGCVVRAKQRANFDEIFRPQGTGIWNNCSFYLNTNLSAGNNTNWMANANQYQDIIVDNCIFFNGVNLVQVGLGDYSGDHNVFMSSNVFNTGDRVVFQWSGGYITTLSSWQAAVGQDANSVYLKREEQTSGNSKALWMGVASGWNSGALDGDWRINPNAVVYDGSNNPWTGQFPDGTPITEAGPQTHWDWNTHQFELGPPTKFPTVPASLSDAQTYISDPDSWNWYP